VEYGCALPVLGDRTVDQCDGEGGRFGVFDAVPDDFAGENVQDRVEPIGVFARAVKHRDVPAPELVVARRMDDGFGSFGAGSRALFAAVAVLSVPARCGGRRR
jgi:hypothetical protein